MKFQYKIFIAATVFYIITACFSKGYYHADEHYQIIEFAGVLDGTGPLADLPWEYRAHIRPAIQPVLGHLVFQALRWVSIHDPYAWAFVLRLVTALLAVSILYYFTNACKPLISPEKWKLFLFLSYFLWFLPFINVRFSSETWSGLLFLLGTSLVLKKHHSYGAYWLLGGVLGLSFLFRFQMALSAMGLLLWLRFIRKEPLGKIAVAIAAGGVVVFAGTIIDTWFYGTWVCTPWNYVHAVIHPVGIDFGASPWYNYLYFIFRFPFSVLSYWNGYFVFIGYSNHKTSQEPLHLDYCSLFGHTLLNSP